MGDERSCSLRSDHQIITAILSRCEKSHEKVDSYETKMSLVELFAIICSDTTVAMCCSVRSDESLSMYMVLGFFVMD